MQLGFSRRSKWTDAELLRLSTAWNANTALAHLASRFKVSQATILNQLGAARKAGLPVADSKTKNCYGS